MLRVGLRRGRQELSGPTGACRAHLMAQDGDKWRTLPAECTHISNSITLSQHGNSHCQSGSPIYANTRKWANICVRNTVSCLLLHQGFIHAFIPGALPLLCACVRACAIHSALLYFYYDKKISMMEGQPYSLQPQSPSNLSDAQTLRNMMYEGHTFFIFPSHPLPCQAVQIM